MDTAVASGRMGGRRARLPARAGRVIAVAALVAAAAIPVSRFLTAGSDDSGPAPRIPTLVDRLGTLRQQVTLTPDDGAAWRSLAEAATQDAVRTGNPGSYETARRAVAEATRLEPLDQRTSVVAGVLALSLHDFARAYDLGEAAVEANPANADALGVLVDASVELGRYDEAARHLQAMLDRRPGATALARASYLRELYGDLPGATAAMQQALSAAQGDPADTAAMAELLGNLQLAAGRISEAVNSFEQALQKAPERIGASLGLARAWAARGDVAAAIALAAETADRSPQPAAATLLGELRIVAGDLAGADDAFALVRANEQLLAAAGVTTDLESALFEADHGDAARAVDLARASYGIRQTVFTADTLGWALTRAGRAAEAIPFVEQALRLDTASAAMRIHAARAYDAAGQGEPATAQLLAAFELSPWPALHLRPAALELAEELLVPVPTGWQL